MGNAHLHSGSTGANNFYMTALNLTDRPCLVVGGGPVALEKIEGLVAADARVTVVAKRADDEVHALAREGSIELHVRPYESSDLDRKFVTIAATSDTSVNVRVFEDAERQRILVNVVDVPSLCNFILPAVVRQGPLAVAVSTAGASPALAKRIKAEIAERLGREHAELATMLSAERPWAKQNLPTYHDRKRFFERVVHADPDPIEDLAQGQVTRVRELIEKEKQLALREARPDARV